MSTWLSGVPQGSHLRPVVLVILFGSLDSDMALNIIFKLNLSVYRDNEIQFAPNLE